MVQPQAGQVEEGGKILYIIIFNVYIWFYIGQMEEGGKMCCWQEMFVFVSVQLQYDDNKTGKCWASRFRWLSIYDHNRNEKVQRWHKNRQKTFLSLRQRGSCTWNLVTLQIFDSLRWLWWLNYGLNHFHQVCRLLPLPPPLLHLDAKKGRIEVAKNQNSCFFSVDCQQQKTSNREEDDILLGVE